MIRGRLHALVVGLCVAGIGVAGYLTLTHYAGIDPVCTAGGGCERVQASEYAELAGVPVALLGLIGYVVVLVTSLARGEVGLLAPAGLAVAGFAFSAYLQYRSLVTIDATCVWCLASAVLMTGLLAATVARVLREP